MSQKIAWCGAHQAHILCPEVLEMKCTMQVEKKTCLLFGLRWYVDTEMETSKANPLLCSLWLKYMRLIFLPWSMMVMRPLKPWVDKFDSKTIVCFLKMDFFAFLNSMATILYLILHVWTWMTGWGEGERWWWGFLWSLWRNKHTLELKQVILRNLRMQLEELVTGADAGKMVLHHCLLILLLLI